MTKLIIPTEQLESFQAMAAILDKKQRDYGVTVIISLEQKSITWIGGNAPNLNRMTQPLEKGHGLKQATFALAGDFFCQAINSVSRQDKKGGKHSFEPLVLTLDYKNGNYVSVTHVETPRILNATNETYPPLRKFETLSVFTEHLDYLQANEQRACHSVSVAGMSQICDFSDTHMPFDYLQLNAETRDIKIQQAGELKVQKLPDNLKLPIQLAFNPATLDALKRLLSNTNAAEIFLAMEGESITISTPEQTVTKSIAGLNDFYNRTPEKTVAEATLIVDITCLKAEIDAQRRYREEKKKNECYMLFHNNQLLIFNGMTGNNLSRMVFVKDLRIDETRLYRFRPKDVIDAKIANMLSLKQVKLVITKNSKGECHMEFYSSAQESVSYIKIPVESEDGSIEAAMEVKQDYLERAKDDSHQPML